MLKSITELELKWSNVFDGFQNEASEKKVLGELKPHGGKLKKLSIMSYGGIEFPNWVGDPSLLHLVYVSIDGCGKCVSLPSLGQLSSLKELYISNMNEVRVVGSDFLGTTTNAFPSLKILHFKNMRGWEKWSTNSGVVFPRLEQLLISGCPNLIIVSFESIPSLRVLDISGCGYGVLRSLVSEDSTITRLNIRRISGLTDGAWKGIMMNLWVVEKLRVYGCNEIRYFCDSEASKVVVNLRKLEVMDCSKLVSVGINYLFLTSVSVWDCSSMKHCICGNNIETLTISGCRSMTYVICGNSIESLTIYDCGSMANVICGQSIQCLSLSECRSLTTVSFPKAEEEEHKYLKSLYIWGCEKLLVIKESEGEQNIINNTISNRRRRTSMLESVYIMNWENLKTVNELSYSIHLTRLHLQNFKSLETLPDTEFLNLTSLKHIVIRKCPSMDVCFPRGNWPPNLYTLQIGELKKPIWGNQNFPTSLVDLTLFGMQGGDENISEDLLPTSLTSLYISGFEKLETVSKGLQHLISLQHLWIWECPNIKDVPETLLPSLLSLTIFRCPKLEERTKGRDSHYWPLISHIPYIHIYD